MRDLLTALWRPRDVVSVRLMGGLGNQMFQYAAGAAVCARTGSRLHLDTSFLRKKSTGYTARALQLDGLCIDAAIDVLPRWRLKSLKKCTEVAGAGPETLARLQGGGWSLSGYWQSERCFPGIRPALLQQFRPARPLSSQAAGWAGRIAAAPEAVSVHVRRGDYVSNADAAATHGVCDLAYYREALARLQAGAGPLEVFVFSDDPDWVRTQFDIGHPFHAVVPEPGASAVEDIHLMALCRHHIVANSSFSWWGAWLSERGGRQFAPRRWFASTAVSDAGIVPDAWTRI